MGHAIFHALGAELPVVDLQGRRLILPEFTLSCDDSPIGLSEALVLLVKQATAVTDYDILVFHRGETIDSFHERNGRYFAQFALAAQYDSEHVIIYGASGLVKVNVITGEKGTP